MSSPGPSNEGSNSKDLLRFLGFDSVAQGKMQHIAFVPLKLENAHR